MSKKSIKTIEDIKRDNGIYKKLYSKAKSLGIPEEDINELLFHVDKLANIAIESYIKSKEAKSL